MATREDQLKPSSRQMSLREFIDLDGERIGVPKEFRDYIFETESDFEHYDRQDRVKIGRKKDGTPTEARGVAQLVPGTAQKHGVDINDPIDNAHGGLLEMKELLDKYTRETGDVRKAMLLTAAGYNAGESAVRKYNGIPPYEETQNYVRGLAKRLKNYQGSQTPANLSTPEEATPVATAQPSTKPSRTQSRARFAVPSSTQSSMQADAEATPIIAPGASTPDPTVPQQQTAPLIRPLTEHEAARDDEFAPPSPELLEEQAKQREQPMAIDAVSIAAAATNAARRSQAARQAREMRRRVEAQRSRAREIREAREAEKLPEQHQPTMAEVKYAEESKERAKMDELARRVNQEQGITTTNQKPRYAVPTQVDLTPAGMRRGQRRISESALAPVAPASEATPPPGVIDRVKDYAYRLSVPGLVVGSARVGAGLGSKATGGTYDEGARAFDEANSTIFQTLDDYQIPKLVKRGVNQALGAEERPLTADDIRLEETQVRDSLQAQGKQQPELRAVTRAAEAFSGDLINLLSNVVDVVPSQTASDLTNYLKRRAYGLTQSATRTPTDERGKPIQIEGTLPQVRAFADDAIQEVTYQGMNVVRLMALTRATGAPLSTVLAGEAAIGSSDRPASERIEAISKAFILGKVIERYGNLNRAATALGFGTLGAAEAYAESGDARKAAVAGLGGAALGYGLGADEGVRARDVARGGVRAVNEAASRVGEAAGLKRTPFGTGEEPPLGARVEVRMPDGTVEVGNTPRVPPVTPEGTTGVELESGRAIVADLRDVRIVSEPRARLTEGSVENDRNASANIPSVGVRLEPPAATREVKPDLRVEEEAPRIEEGIRAQDTERPVITESPREEAKPGTAPQPLAKIEPKRIIRHSDPNIDGGEVVGSYDNGDLKVQNNSGSISRVKNPRKGGNREAAISTIREEGEQANVRTEQEKEGEQVFTEGRSADQPHQGVSDVEGGLGRESGAQGLRTTNEPTEGQATTPSREVSVAGQDVVARQKSDVVGAASTDAGKVQPSTSAISFGVQRTDTALAEQVQQIVDEIRTEGSSFKYRGLDGTTYTIKFSQGYKIYKGNEFKDTLSKSVAADFVKGELMLTSKENAQYVEQPTAEPSSRVDNPAIKEQEKPSEQELKLPKRRRRTSADPTRHSLSRFVQLKGGIRPDKGDANIGELRRLSTKESGRIGLVNRNSEHTAETMARAAFEEGYLRDLPDIVTDPEYMHVDPNGFLRALEADIAANGRHYSTQNDAFQNPEELPEMSKSEEEFLEKEYKFFNDSRTQEILREVQQRRESDAGITEELSIIAESYGIESDAFAGSVIENAIYDNAPQEPDAADSQLHPSAPQGVFAEESDEDLKFDFADEEAPPEKPRTRLEDFYKDSRAAKQPGLGFAQAEEGLFAESGPTVVAPEEEYKVPANATREQLEAVEREKQYQRIVEQLGERNYGTLADMVEYKEPTVDLAREIFKSAGRVNRGVLNDVVPALTKLSEMRGRGGNVFDYVNQPTLTGERELTPRQEQFLSAMDKTGKLPAELFGEPEAKPAAVRYKSPQERLQSTEFGAGVKPSISNILLGVRNAYRNLTGAELDRGLVNYSGMGRTEDIWVRNLSQLERASESAHAAALEAVGARTQAKILIKQVANKIDQIMAKEGGWEVWREIATHDRLVGIRTRWLQFSKAVSGMSDRDFQSWYTGTKRSPGVRDLVQRLESYDSGRQFKIESGLEKNDPITGLVDSMVASENYDQARAYMERLFNLAAENTRMLLADEVFNARSESDAFKKATALWKDKVEPELARSHAYNEGVFTDALGPNEIYIPLTPMDKEGNVKLAGAGTRHDRYRKPRNVHNMFATGQAADYDLSPKALSKSVVRSMRANAAAKLLKSLPEMGLAQVLKRNEAEPQAFEFEGNEYRAVVVRVGKDRTILKEGRTIHIPARRMVIPYWLERELRPILEGDDYSPGAFGKLMSKLNWLGMVGPLDAVYHITNLTGATVAMTPFVGTGVLSKLGSISAPTKLLSSILNVATMNGFDEEFERDVQEVARMGSAPTRYGEVSTAYTKKGREYARRTGAKLDFTPFSAFLFGPAGFDMKVRVMLLRAAREMNPSASPTEVNKFMGIVGNYTHELQGSVERFLKGTMLAPFYTAGSTMWRNGIKIWTSASPLALIPGRLGDAFRIPLPTKGLPWGKRAAYHLATLWGGGAIGLVALWMLLYKGYTGKWPQDDPRSRLLQFPLNKRDRNSWLAKQIYGDNDKDAYVNMAFFSPLVERGSRALGISSAYNARQAGATSGQMVEEMEKDIFNSAIHPFVSGPATRAGFALSPLAAEPYVQSLRDVQGRRGLKLRSVVGKAAPGLATWQARSIEAVANLNSFARNVAGMSGFVSESLGLDDAQVKSPKDVQPNKWAKMITDLVFPRLFKGTYDVETQRSRFERADKVEHSLANVHNGRQFKTFLGLLQEARKEKSDDEGDEQRVRRQNLEDAMRAMNQVWERARVSKDVKAQKQALAEIERMAERAQVSNMYKPRKTRISPAQRARSREKSDERRIERWQEGIPSGPRRSRFAVPHVR